jgi:hypothetical protein
MKITDCQPDSGNPTVRDERGAYGNVSYGGIRNPLHKLKRCMSETLCLRLRAPYFYPTSGACLQRGNSGTWESHLSPCERPGVGDRVTKGPGVDWALRPDHEPIWDTTNHGSRQGIGKASDKRSPREGQRAVVAVHSTREGGEVRPKRPTGGKAPSGRASAGRRQGRDIELTTLDHGRPVDCGRAAATLSEEPYA